tara:strand:+ start:272 stop:418 length:147 start_codon:yes stop_codon:yes gene_type:complete
MLMARQLKKVSKALTKASKLHKNQAKIINKYITKNAKPKNPRTKSRKK